MPVHASDKNNEKYKDFLSIPHVLRAQARSGIHLDDYLRNVLSPMRSHGFDTVSLRGDDVERKLIRHVPATQMRRISKFMQYDINLDNKIDKDEISRAVQMRYSRYSPERQLMMKNLGEKLFRFDRDGDGVLAYSELMTVSDEERLYFYDNDKILRKIRELLALDPNKDKVLTVAELKILALKAFSTMDQNGDTTISRNEWDGVVRATSSVSKLGKLEDCHFNQNVFPENLKVYGTGTEQGRKLGFAVDQSGYKASEVDVVVNQRKHPVALILSGSQPVIWNIQRTKNTKIHAVFVTGLHKQSIIGVDKNVPIINSSGADKRCGVSYFDSMKLSNLNKVSKHLFGKNADVFYRVNSHKGNVVLGVPSYNPDMLVRDDKLQVQDLKLNVLLTIDDAIEGGFVRKATQADIDMVYQVYASVVQEAAMQSLVEDGEGAEVQKMENIPLHSAFSTEWAYVVLKEFSYPKGINGLFAKAFIIPEGVSIPTGNAGSSAVFDMNTKQCISNDHPNGRCLKMH